MYTIYGFPPEVQKCPNCDAAKRLCDTKKIDYKFIPIATSKNEEGPIMDENVVSTILQLTERPQLAGLSLPIVEKDGVYIGSFAQLRQSIVKSV